MPDYIDGPAVSPWKIIPDETEFVIQRAGCDERAKASRYKMPYEYHFRVMHRMEADHLAALLNERDALAAWECSTCGARFPQRINPVLLLGVTHCSKCVEFATLATYLDATRAALRTLADAVRAEIEGRHTFDGYDKRVSDVWEAEQAAREVLRG